MPTGTRVTRLDYSSTSGVDDSRTSVSGAVFVPSGSWPQGGWPLIAYAHGTTGLARDCGPSDHPDMFGDIATIGSFVRAGYAVVTTDYQGLGIRVDAPPHPYLEPRTAAHNVIDAVRAARAVEPTIGPKWVVVGPSQGGAAAWATAELYPRFRDADSGDLVGAVAMSPVLDVSRYPTAAQDGTLNSAQRFLYPLIVVGASHVDPQIDPADHLGGMSASEISSLVSCATGRTALAAQTRSSTPRCRSSYCPSSTPTFRSSPCTEPPTRSPRSTSWRPVCPAPARWATPWCATAARARDIRSILDQFSGHGYRVVCRGCPSMRTVKWFAAIVTSRARCTRWS